MNVEWFGQSAFRLTEGDLAVVIDPAGDMEALRASGRRWDYPEPAGLTADLLAITHEHLDHNGAERVGGDPVVVRSTAGTFDTPAGPLVAIAAEHDDAAGTLRGPNSFVAFSLGGVRVAHLGDLGQRALRPEQVAALGDVDLLFVPVGGGPTLGAAAAAEVVALLAPAWVVPMHYRTPRIDFLEPADEFLSLSASVERFPAPAFELPARTDVATVLVPAVP